MRSRLALRAFASVIGPARITVAALGFVVLGYAYALRIAVGDSNPLDYFGYFTNQTTLLVCVVLIVSGSFRVSRRAIPGWLNLLRAMATAYLVVVGVVYNTLVPGTGSAPAWVSAVLHIVLPLIVTMDWILVADRARLRWRRLWLIVVYPLVWVTVVLVRGATDGWVPYGFLLPERGFASLGAHLLGLLGAVLAAGALVWAASRVNLWRPTPDGLYPIDSSGSERVMRG
ncbi:Pr6Pr family membrane protein [Agromyces larvae]|uniref:Pr6Pr family membrane protein n=1 Tax=Agromyces larvae TaxID=2929802 RepID=A0ABY4BUA0_9MICO|nr:Pr6Pr family membrane protein [Agromyces larvae]UOE42720.1 Pr6Pr family membrane protein [Agromyces larvae]